MKCCLYIVTAINWWQLHILLQGLQAGLTGSTGFHGLCTHAPTTTTTLCLSERTGTKSRQHQHRTIGNGSEYFEWHYEPLTTCPDDSVEFRAS
ncbi:GL19230 [Drosophila persimilis]|uniref:GL19230 n=1 Tax=Drosophila persimilis TaxID=7234 RepID=B4G847_DROPE|nr:GL19230 [Drosophila persimilis]